MVSPHFLPARHRKLPVRAHGYRREIAIARHTFVIYTAQYEDGSLGEVSAEMPKGGTAFRAVLQGLLQAVSLGLQHGVPLEVFVEEYVCTRFEPAGIVDGHEHFPATTSILDLIFRDLAVEYLGRKDLITGHKTERDAEEDD